MHTVSMFCIECSFCVGFESREVRGKENLSSTEEWLQMRPQVQCSPAAIILTAKGWDYIHLLVNRG